MFDGAFARCVAVYYGAIDERPAVLGMFQKTLVFEDPERSKYGGIVQRRALREPLHDFRHGRGSACPQHVHQPKFGIRESLCFLACHSIKELVVPGYTKARVKSIKKLIVASVGPD